MESVLCKKGGQVLLKFEIGLEVVFLEIDLTGEKGISPNSIWL